MSLGPRNHDAVFELAARVEEHLREPAHRGERCPKLVTHARDKLVLGGQGRLELTVGLLRGHRVLVHVGTLLLVEPPVHEPGRGDGRDGSAWSTGGETDPVDRRELLAVLLGVGRPGMFVPVSA